MVGGGDVKQEELEVMQKDHQEIGSLAPKEETEINGMKSKSINDIITDFVLLRVISARVKTFHNVILRKANIFHKTGGNHESDIWENVISVFRTDYFNFCIFK